MVQEQACLVLELQRGIARLRKRRRGLRLEMGFALASLLPVFHHGRLYTQERYVDAVLVGLAVR